MLTVFEYFILLTILFNCIVLAIDAPLPESDMSEVNNVAVSRFSHFLFTLLNHKQKQEPVGHYVPVPPDIFTSWTQSPRMNCSGASVAGIDSNSEIVQQQFFDFFCSLL